MKTVKQYILLIYLLIIPIALNAQLQFNSIALNRNDEFLFNSIEIHAGKQYNKTLFYGYRQENNFGFKALTFYPENLFYSSANNSLYIQNRIGLYVFDMVDGTIKSVDNYPNYADKDEYTIYRLSEANFSPNYRYVLAKIATSSVKAGIYLFDMKTKEKHEVVADADIMPGKPVGRWSKDSNYFIYEKNNNLYYFSVSDFYDDKLLSEDWRYIGKGSLNSTMWTGDNNLIWLEDNLIYRSDPRQFFSRAIYRKYIRQGKVIGKMPFKFNPIFDSFEFNDVCGKFILVKNHTSIFYYSLEKNIFDNPYLQLRENMRYASGKIYDSGKGYILVDVINNGKIKKELYLVKHADAKVEFKKFISDNIRNTDIHTVSSSGDEEKFVVNTSKGAFCYDFTTEKPLWVYGNGESIINSVNTTHNEWIIASKYTAVTFNHDTGDKTELFACSLTDAGFINENNNQVGIICGENKYELNKTTGTIKAADFAYSDLYQLTKTDKFRLLNREINKGFYKEGVLLKELYTGKFIPITGEPILRYKLYQPEIKLGLSYYMAPSPTKYEIALVFDCTKTNEGIFPILKTLNQFKITSTFFISGTFMEANPDTIKEIVNFDIEVGNLFQYYIDLTDSNFLIDKNFIRQGLSANEETYFDLTGRNFSPIWHTPSYTYNDNIIKYGNESGYKFITYNLDSMDWVGPQNSMINHSLYMENAELITRILKRVKPGHIIIFSAGQNDSLRKEWLFNDLDLLISELMRAGYSFTTVSDLLKKYRE